MEQDQEIARPSEVLQLATAYRISRAIHVITQACIPDHLYDAPRSCTELAAITGCCADAIYRVLRVLAGVGLFIEVTSHCFALTHNGRLLASQEHNSIRDIVLNMGADWQWKVWGAMPKSFHSGQPTVDETLGAPIYQYLSTHPEDHHIFNAAMANHSRRIHPLVLKAYDFHNVELVIDVGGGYGNLLIHLLHTYPALHALLLESHSFAEDARRHIIEAGLDERCQVVPGDFFVAIPSAGDVYLLAGVLHDWNDDQAVMILRNCVKAMKPEGHILVFQQIIQPGDAPQTGKFLDLDMLVITGGRERTREEFEHIFQSAGLVLSRIIPTESKISILECINRH